MKYCMGTKMISQPFRLEDVNVYFDPRVNEIIITTAQLKMGRHYETQYDSEPKHDCQKMRCKQGYHVLARADMGQYQSDVLENLCRFLDESCELQIDGVMREGR